MSSIATCPQCAAQLAVPETASASDQAQCPECRAEFSLAAGDLRYLSAAKIVEPVETAPPEDLLAPTEPAWEEPSPVVELPEAPPSEAVSPEAELPETPLPETPLPETPLPETPLPETPLPEISLPESPLPETPLPETELPQDMRTADTILSTSTLSGWEERLRTAINSTEAESSDETEIAEPSATEESLLEKSPKFEFEMDPPAESPTGNVASPASNLPEAGEWFEPTPKLSSEETQEAAVQPPVDNPPMATKPAAPMQRRTKNSLLKRATVVVLFGAAGIVLGQYALLWLRGPSADYLHIAQFVPRAIFPTAQQQILAPQISTEEHEEHLVSNDTQSEEPPIEQPAEQLPAEEKIEETIAETSSVEREAATRIDPPEVTRDDHVQPATVQLPEVGPSPEPSLLPSTNTSAADFKQLLGTGHDSAQALVDGDLSTRESFRAMGHAFMALCQLAERIDFVHAANLDEDAQDQALSARALFRALAKQSATQDDLALIASRWWQHQARSNQGIFLVGRIQDVETMGSHTLCQVAIVHAAESTLVPVLLPTGAAYQVGEQIGVVGTIVGEPGSVIPGFTADLPQLAVAVDSFSVPAE